VPTTNKDFRVKNGLVAEGSVSALSIVKTGGSSYQYLMADGSVKSGQATVSATAPLSPVNGDLWLSSVDGSAYVYYVDTNSSQWIEIGSDSVIGPTGPGVPTGGTAGQVLSKIDSSNYNTQWVAQSGGGSPADDDQNILANQIFG
jgi:hypothetical protein